MAQFSFAFKAPYEDPKYRNIDLDVNCIIKTFEEDIDDKTMSEIKKAAFHAFEKAAEMISSQGVGFQGLQSKISVFQSMVILNLTSSGFHVTDVEFNKLGPDDNTKARIMKLEEAAMFAANPDLLAQRMAEGEKAHREAVAASAASAAAAEPTPVAPSPVGGAKFCRNCGSPAGAGKFCTFCGSLLNP